MYLDKLQKLQNRAGRIILNVKPQTRVSNDYIHDILKLETLTIRRQKHIYVLLYKIFNDLAPEYLKSKFKYKTTNYFLRNANNLILPKHNTNYCKRTFLYEGSKMYNNLPTELRRPDTLNIFLKNLDSWI